MRAGDRAADPVSVGGDGLALGDQLVDEGAQAHLVVGIGPLQRRDLGANDGLELARPRHGPLDAVAHGGDLAANGLGEGEHRVRRDGLGLGEARGDRGHRAGGQPHLGDAHVEASNGEHHHDRQEQDAGQDGPLAGIKVRDSGERGLIGAVLHLKHVEQAAGPEQRAQRRDPVGAAGRARGEALHHVRHVAAVVIGDAAGVRGHDRRRRGRRGAGLSLLLGPVLRPLLRTWGGLQLVARAVRGRQARLGVRRVRSLAGRDVVELEGLLDGGQRRLRRILELLLLGHDRRLFTPKKLPSPVRNTGRLPSRKVNDPDRD